MVTTASKDHIRLFSNRVDFYGEINRMKRNFQIIDRKPAIIVLRRIIDVFHLPKKGDRNYNFKNKHMGILTYCFSILAV